MMAPASKAKGSFGKPGSTAIMPTAPDAIISVRRLRMSCDHTSAPMPPSSSDAARVTTRPDAIEMSRAGICETRPSPTDSSA